MESIEEIMEEVKQYLRYRELDIKISAELSILKHSKEEIDNKMITLGAALRRNEWARSKAFVIGDTVVTIGISHIMVRELVVDNSTSENLEVAEDVRKIRTEVT